MKIFFTYLAVALIFLIIESVLLRIVLPPPFIPDALLIMVFYIGFGKVSIERALTAFALGYLADVFSGGVIGASSFTLVFAFVITSMFAKIVSLNSMLIKIGGAIFISISKGIAMYILLRFLNQEIQFYIIFPTAIATGIASPFIITLLQKIESYLAPYKGENRLFNS